MNEESVRAVFLKYYTGGDLNEALMAAGEEVRLTVIKETGELSESLREIVGAAIRGQCLLDLFSGIAAAGHVSIPVDISYIYHLDNLRKITLDVIRYTHDNYDVMDVWFREEFKKENIKLMVYGMEGIIERTANMPHHIRGVDALELKFEDIVLNDSLVGILGTERFKKYAIEYNKCVKVLRRCQAESIMLDNAKDMNES